MRNPKIVVGLDNFHYENTFEFEEIYWGDCRHEDIAVLSLSRKVVDHPNCPDRKFPGELFRTLDNCDLDLSRVKQVNYAGFSEDFSFFGPQKGYGHIQHDCHAEIKETSLKHFCDMDKGGSGGPIWIKFGSVNCLVGVNAGHVCPRKPEYISEQKSCAHEAINNYGVPISDKWRKLIDQLENGKP